MMEDLSLILVSLGKTWPEASDVLRLPKGSSTPEPLNYKGTLVSMSRSVTPAATSRKATTVALSLDSTRGE